MKRVLARSPPSVAGFRLHGPAPLTLRARLVLISTMLAAGLLAALGVVSYRVLAERLDADATDRLRDLTEGLHGYLQFDAGAPVVRFDPDDGDQAAFVHEATRYYRVYDTADGRLLVESDGFAPLGARLTAAEARAIRGHPRQFDLATDYGRIRISSSFIADATGRPYLLQVGVPLVQIDSGLARYRAQLWWGAGPALLVAGLASWWLSGLALSPLRRMAAAARAIDVRALHQRLPARGAGDELDALAESFNDTLERLEQGVGEMRQFSASLAHEMRTPLTALRGEIELSLRGANGAQRAALGSQIESIDRLTRLIEQILTLARAESGQIPLAFSRMDAGELAASVVEQLEPVAQASGILLRLEPSPPALVHGDPAWLRRLLLNLIDNALKYTAKGGRVSVRARTDGREVRIEVRDTGAGMTPAVASRVFERFFRGDPARPASVPHGAGLGLSLAKWIVERHGGTIAVASRPGAGATFVATLPAAPD